MKTMNGADALVESLKREGVDSIFGISGGQALPIYDALARESSGTITNYLVRHEQGAAHMAEGYAKATGRVGVCLATSGPGATNLVTGIADAMLDSVPMVAITGQVPTTSIGTDAFQEADIMGITMPIVKHSFQPRHVEEIPEMVKKAFYLASTGRPGPVLIDLPKDVANQQMKNFQYPETVFIRGYQPHADCDQALIEQAAELIYHAERPVLYVGGGAIISGAYKEVLALAEKGQIPVVSTLMGRGIIPDSHPLSLHMLGMHGTAYANWAVDSADLLIVVGARFDDRVTGNPATFAPRAKVIHIEMDPAELHKIRRADVAIHGDARAALSLILEQIEPQDHTEWVKRVSKWKAEEPIRYRQSKEIKPQYVIEEMGKISGMEGIFVTDVGQHQMWAAQFLPLNKPRQWLTSGGAGTMGFGLPAAIGAKVARPKEDVWLVTGDGSFQMCLQELATSAVYKIPVKVVLLNNAALGMVKQWQTLFFDKRHEGIFLRDVPDYEKLAEAYGLVGMTVNKPEEVIPALKRAKEINDRTVVINVKVDQEAHVYPMIPGGMSVADMRLHPMPAESKKKP